MPNMTTPIMRHSRAPPIAVKSTRVCHAYSVSASVMTTVATRALTTESVVYVDAMDPTRMLSKILSGGRSAVDGLVRVVARRAVEVARADGRT